MNQASFNALAMILEKNSIDNFDENIVAYFICMKDRKIDFAYKPTFLLHY